MILIEELAKGYGARTAVDSVCFAVEPGTVTGLLGPNGGRGEQS
jgi:ABC-2 type transport system ATP-binding protein